VEGGRGLVRSGSPHSERGYLLSRRRPAEVPRAATGSHPPFPAVIASYLASTGLRSKSRFTHRCGANPVGMGDILQSFFFSPAELRRLGD
jgi:hypothetical protein